MKRILVAVMAAILVLGVGAMSAAASTGQGVSAASTGVSSVEECPICGVDTSDYAGPLSDDEVQGLLLALNDEYRAWAIYDQVIQDFGQVRPFSNIRSAEVQHVRALVSLFDRYGVSVPENPWPGQVPSFDSVRDAAAAGVQAELDNAALYGRLFDSTQPVDITTVYEALQRASIENHLPAFQRAAGL